MTVWHMHGAGNRFAVLDVRDKILELSETAKTLCAMLGADGLMAVDHSDVADLRLHFYNADGSRGEMCGNGSRCLCRFAYDNGLVGEEMTVQTDAGIIRARRLAENRYAVELNLPGVVDPERTPQAAYVELGAPGVPHGIVELPDLSWDQREALRSRAVALRHDSAFPKGANINFFTRLDAHTVRVLTYERYVEEYTLACGTGCASIAVVLWLQGRLPGGILTAQNPGGDLTVTVTGATGKITGLLLEGPAEVTQILQI